MPTQYPTRTNTELIDVCKCGHGWYNHKTTKLEECIECLCPKYEFEQKLRMDEIVALKNKLLDDNRRTNYVQ